MDIIYLALHVFLVLNIVVFVQHQLSVPFAQMDIILLQMGKHVHHVYQIVWYVLLHQIVKIAPMVTIFREPRLVLHVPIIVQLVHLLVLVKFV